MARLHNQPDTVTYPYEILDHAQTKARLPAIGPDVSGSIYCPLDGHVNSLRLFRALHAALKARSVDYRADHAVTAIEPRAGGFALTGAWGEMRAAKVVLAAGLGNARLAPMVGLEAPMKPSRGQIIVTEKAAPFLRYPVVTVRQTDEGGVMIGDSEEADGSSLRIDHSISSVMADRAIRMFPLLGDLNVVRTWTAFRVMTPDGSPVYEQSETCPGAFVAMAHSGVTLAPQHAFSLADYIAAGRSRRKSLSSRPGGSVFRRLSDRASGEVTFTFDGLPVTASAGDSVAAALLAAGVRACRTTPVSGAPRGPYCMMGVCFECLVRIDGMDNRQGCLVTVQEGMRVESQRGSPALTTEPAR